MGRAREVQLTPLSALAGDYHVGTAKTAEELADDLFGGLCPDCQDNQQDVAGKRKIGRRSFCEAHFAKRLGQGPRTKLPAETPAKPKDRAAQVAGKASLGDRRKMSKGKDIDWNQVQRDRDAGMPIAQLEKKYKVSNPTIYTHTHGAAKNGVKARRTNERTNERKARSQNGGSFDAVLAGLRERRAPLDQAISTIEALEWKK